jgi:hypothetical protein
MLPVTIKCVGELTHKDYVPRMSLTYYVTGLGKHAKEFLGKCLLVSKMKWKSFTICTSSLVKGDILQTGLTLWLTFFL